ncbi:glycosyltransferase family 4 protein [Blastococcus sp. VKM Ac-2987]|uniref:glycosyltransferase family 4 protein n=1 Tax=Blastococcus sp. VKM Ac-2987 TaxID=3004141 RepID=UPI0022AB7726|nr:glycosyltransferase family 4 protein [Blastococcus sp. VKM Ac-2987]MCZ2860377.1 glycosyltransferase family 4 protein [Blastococcus sp. VKM Ac-2987]
MPIRSAPIDVLFLSWRDASHPEGGGSERYVHRMAEGMAARGLRVVLFCAAHDRAPADEVLRGVRIVRRGGRLGVYPRAMLHVLRSRPRVVVDVQNGLPFFSRLVTRGAVVVLVHHVHREQWPIVFGPRAGALGWWIESVLAPRLYRRSRYVTVSGATAEELASLGVDPARTTIVPNGLDAPPAVDVPRSAAPRLVVLGRLVPHKQVEHALEVVARLRGRWPGLRLSVVGEGWWEERLREEADRLGITGRVDFHGYVGEREKHELLARSWVHLCPSVKEGWGLVVSEAGGHEVPTVGYRSAGGLRESVLDGRTGILVEDLDGLTEAVDGLLHDDAARTAMGRAAARYAASLTWPAGVATFAAVLDTAAGGSAAGAVVQDVDGGVVPLRGGAVGVGDGGDAGDDGDAEPGTDEQGDQRTRERLHPGTRFRRGGRRRVTVDAPAMIHNAAPPTMPSAPA